LYAKSFTENSRKLRKINYFLTEKGFEEKLRLLQHFLKRKETEYNNLKQEWEQLVNDKSRALSRSSNGII